MSIPYNLESPGKTYKLPRKYREISGIWLLEERNSLAFVQDQAIRVQLFDLSTEETAKFKKHDPGDSEDIVILDGTAYILTAGKRPAIYEIPDWEGGSARCKRHDLDLEQGHDPEGLCHDAKEGRLLVACKGSPDKGNTNRQIFAFDAASGKRSDAPVLTVDSRDFLDKGKDRFNPSGIAIHPVTDDIYLVGTRGAKMVVRYGREGTCKDAAPLDDDLFLQPEGIAFTKSGDMFICSEGGRGKKGRRPRVFLFPYNS